MLVRFAIIIALVATACGKDDKKKPAAKKPPIAKQDIPAAKPVPVKPAPTPTPAPAAAATLDLATFGYQIDVPATWSVSKDSEKSVMFKIPTVKQGGVTVMPSLTLMNLPSGAKSADSAAKSCSGTVKDKQDLEGAFYYVCEIEAAGQKLLSLEYVIAGDKEFIHCSGSGADITDALAACKSIKKK